MSDVMTANTHLSHYADAFQDQNKQASTCAEFVLVDYMCAVMIENYFCSACMSEDIPRFGANRQAHDWCLVELEKCLRLRIEVPPTAFRIETPL